MAPSVRVFCLAFAVTLAPGASPAGSLLPPSGMSAATGIYAAQRPTDRGAGWERSPRAEEIQDTVQGNSGTDNPGGFNDIPVVALPGTLPMMLGGLGLAALILRRRWRG